MSQLPTVPPARPAEPETQLAGTVTRPGFLDIIRLLVQLFALGSLAFWGFTGFVFPWNIVAGIGAPLLAVLIWALFVSPKALVRVHPFIQAVVELFVYVAVTAAWWSIGQVWLGLGFGLIAVIVGVLIGRRQFA